MNKALLTERDIAEWCGYKRQGDIERWLRKERIHFFYVRDNKIATTIGLINAAKLTSDNTEIEFE